jgi:hypothetical protein
MKLNLAIWQHCFIGQRAFKLETVTHWPCLKNSYWKTAKLKFQIVSQRSVNKISGFKLDEIDWKVFFFFWPVVGQLLGEESEDVRNHNFRFVEMHMVPAVDFSELEIRIRTGKKSEIILMKRYFWNNFYFMFAMRCVNCCIKKECEIPIQSRKTNFKYHKEIKLDLQCFISTIWEHFSI